MTFDLPMERVAAAGRGAPNMTTPHVDPAEAHSREVEIAELAARLTARSDARHDGFTQHERGARAGLTAYRECYELVRLIAATDPHDTVYDPYLVSLAEVALESANG